MREDVEEMITDQWFLRDKPWVSAYAMEQKKRNAEKKVPTKLEKYEEFVKNPPTAEALLDDPSLDPRFGKEISHEG